MQIASKYFEVVSTLSSSYSEVLNKNRNTEYATPKTEKLYANVKRHHIIMGPRRDKTCLRGFRQREFQISLLSYRD